MNSMEARIRTEVRVWALILASLIGTGITLVASATGMTVLAYVSTPGAAFVVWRAWEESGKLKRLDTEAKTEKQEGWR